MDQIILILQWVATVVGAASMIVAALSKVAKLTPSKKDDEFLAGAEKLLVGIIATLDRLALNPNKKEARK